MDKLVKNLQNNLSEQLKYYKYMDRLSLEKKDVIIKGDTETLSEIDRNIEAVACQIIEIEQERLKLLKGHITRESKLTDFIKKLDPESAKMLNNIREELILVVRNIQKVNNVNIYLIKNSIKWIEHSVATIANVIAPESASYNATGRALTNKNFCSLNSSGIVEHNA